VGEYYPTGFTVEDLAASEVVDEIIDAVVEEATTHYEEREAEFGAEAMRQIERQVMLRVIDTRWREHLYEMDYLQEGIHLRAMGQKDPLVEWQREGYGMFAQMVDAIAEDFVKYVMHLQVVHPEPEVSVEEEARDIRYSAADDPVDGTKAVRQAAAAQAVEEGEEPPPPVPEDEPVNVPVVKAQHERVGRNDPCWCESGKKFKHCHGR
jgi:preprotein translocase subunit SecA